MLSAIDYVRKTQLSLSTFHNKSACPITAAVKHLIYGAPSATQVRTASQPKILLYSHDTFGLGNIRRTLLLAENFRRRYPNSPILIITGSPVIHAFRLPPGVDYIKLPSLDRVDAERYEPAFLTGCADEVAKTRAAMIEKIIPGFGPDLLIVDKRASGINNELLPALKVLRRKSPNTKVILGLRDILDEPARTSRTLRENGSFQVIHRFYDEVWIYGLREIFDAAAEYDFPEHIKEKTFYCGYLKRPVLQTAHNGGPRRVLVTTGGGGDGAQMIGAYLEGLRSLPNGYPLASKVIFGPQMPEQTRKSFLAKFGDLAGVRFSNFEADLTSHYAEADVVVSMAGYNTVCELLSHQKRAVLVPRSEPVREQLIRARLLKKLNIFEMVDPRNLTGNTLIRKVIESLKAENNSGSFFDLDGLPRINRRVHDLLEVNQWVS